MKIINGDCIEELAKLEENSIDSIVCDPPYGINFMGKEWDAFVPQPIFWKEVFRVLKHGGHIVAFFGTRTYDWGVMAMRLAGFEIRDCIQWIYGSGFPKSHNIGKAIDKIQGNEREIIGKYQLPDVADGLRKKNWDEFVKKLLEEEPEPINI